MAWLEGDWINKTSLNYITKCEVFFRSFILNPYGSSVDFQWAEGRHNILYVGGVVLKKTFKVSFSIKNLLYKENL